MEKNVGVIIPTKWELPTVFTMAGCAYDKKKVSFFNFFGNKYSVVFSGWGIYGGIRAAVNKLHASSSKLNSILLLGFCSDLKNRLTIGDIVIADSVSNPSNDSLEIHNDEIARMKRISKSSAQQYHFGRIHSLPCTAVASLGLPGLAVDEESYDAAVACNEKETPILIAKTVVKNLPIRSLRKRHEGSNGVGEFVCGLPTMIGIKLHQPMLRVNLSKFFIDYSM